MQNVWQLIQSELVAKWFHNYRPICRVLSFAVCILYTHPFFSSAISCWFDSMDSVLATAVRKFELNSYFSIRNGRNYSKFFEYLLVYNAIFGNYNGDYTHQKCDNGTYSHRFRQL